MADLRFPTYAYSTEGKNADVMVAPRVMFTSYNWEAATPQLEETKLSATGATSVTTLYVPANFSEKYGATWGPEEVCMSIIAGLNSFRESRAAKKGLSESVATATKDGLAKGGGADGIAAMQKAAGEAKIGGILNSAIYAEGQTAFPGQFNVFQKGNPIPMNFVFDMIPRNAGEAEAIVAIIKNFKEKILPQYGKTGVIAPYMLSFPDVWWIEFKGLNGAGFPGQGTKYKDMALVSVDVSYGGSAQSALTFHDGNPVCVQLSLGFLGIKHAYKGGA